MPCDFIFRRLQPADLVSAVHFLPAILVSNDAERHFDVLKACQQLLATGRMFGVLVTSPEAFKSDRIMGVGGAVFVHGSFADAEKNHPVPGFTERILVSPLTGDSVVLTTRQVEKANRGEGLVLVPVLYHWDAALADEEARDLRFQFMRNFIEDFRGYNLREMLSEGTEEYVEWVIRTGAFKLRSRYEQWYENHTEPSPRRCLVGITREEALGDESNVNALLFRYTPPLFAFSGSERRLLSEALRQETDTAIASTLYLSTSAIKKRWAAIFDRVTQVDPELLSGGDSAQASEYPRSTRGPQKRHRLLAYLRHHYEELRP